MKANYVIFHPDSAREKVEVSAKVLINGEVTKNWVGDIWVDGIRKGNEDPFVFSENWLYSYCHATQLRRNTSNCFLQEGSWLIFCSGNAANNGILKVDTVFEIDTVHKWSKLSSGELVLPKYFANHLNNNKSELWERHLKFPFIGQHDGKFTYKSKIGVENSFLPLSNYKRVEIGFEQLQTTLKNKIVQKVKGKYPVLLSEEEANKLVRLIRTKTEIEVIGEIKKDKG